MSALQDCIDFARRQGLSRPQDGMSAAEQAAAELAARDAALVAAREALAKSDPWKQVGSLWFCIHCGHVYDLLSLEPKDTHRLDCVWLAALEAK